MNRMKNQQQQMLKEVSEFQDQMKKYKDRIKMDREVYEKLLFKSDKLINFLYNGSITLSKTIGKIMHHLLLKIPFDMREITGKLVTEDVSKLHEWVLGFEKSEFLKKAKIYRNIGDKILFYKKLELPLLQDAYNRIYEFLRPIEPLADKGEYSVLNTTSTNLHNGSISRMSFSKNVHSSKLIENDEYNANILDELNNPEIGAKKETLTELLVRFSEKLGAETITDMPPVLLEDFIKKFQSTVDSFHSRIVSISLEPKNNFDEEDKMRDPLLPEDLAKKNHDFHVDCLEELQSKLRYLDTRFAYIKLMLDTRETTLDEMSASKLRDLLQKNRELNEDDFSLNYDEKANTDLIKMLEESFNQKDKILRAKKQFIEHLNNIKEDLLLRLRKVFEGLNTVEDQYSVMEKAIINLQTAIQVNKQETIDFTNKTEYLREQKDKLEKELAFLNHQVSEQSEIENKMKEEVSSLETKSSEKSKQLTSQADELVQLQKALAKQKLEFYELSEKLIYIQELQEKFKIEISSFAKQAGQKRLTLNEKVASFNKIIAEKKLGEAELEAIEEKLRILESGVSPKANCACVTPPEVRKEIEKVYSVFETSRDEMQKYDFYLKLIDDFLNSTDVNFNQFLKLTITSTMTLNDKITKIYSNLRDRNLRLLEHLADLFEKSYIESCYAIITDFLRSAERSPTATLEAFVNLQRDLGSNRISDDRPDPVKMLRSNLKLFLNIEELCKI